MRTVRVTIRKRRVLDEVSKAAEWAAVKRDAVSGDDAAKLSDSVPVLEKDELMLERWWYEAAGELLQALHRYVVGEEGAAPAVPSASHVDSGRDLRVYFRLPSSWPVVSTDTLENEMYGALTEGILARWLQLCGGLQDAVESALAAASSHSEAAVRVLCQRGWF